MFKQIQIFLRICRFPNMLRKTNFLSISVLLSELVIFCLKREVPCEFPQKCFKTTEKHSLAACVSLWGEKKFLLIFVHFYSFDQKHLFKQIQIFLRTCPFPNMFKKNFLSISVLFSGIINSWTTKRSSLWMSPKMLQTTEKYSLVLCGSLWGEKQFLLIFFPFYWFDQKSCLNKSKYSSGFSPFQAC